MGDALQTRRARRSEMRKEDRRAQNRGKDEDIGMRAPRAIIEKALTIKR